MKKKLLFLMMLLPMAAVTILTSCGDDDESFGGGDFNNQSSKRIVKLVEEEGSSIYETTFSYDSQGRVIKADETRTSSGSSSHSVFTYQYGELAIVSKVVEEGTYSNGQSYTVSISHSYTLKNGLIVKDVEVQTYNGGHPSTITYTYSYDNNGYMATSSASGYEIESYTDNLTWTNGNLTGLRGGELTYTNISWPKGMFFFFESSNMDRLLWPGGFWGKTPKNMLYKDLYNGLTYDYTITNGLITKVRLIESGNVVYVATYTWK